MSDTIVFFDLETGGTRPQHPDIQLAAVAVRGWEEVESFERKILFDAAAADPEALEINSYDRQTWAMEGRKERAVVAEFGAFLRRHACIERISKRGRSYRVARLAGHNAARFDAPRLRAMFERHDEFLPADVFRPLDTLQLALWGLSLGGEPPESFRLGGLCQRFGIECSGAHDALADVRMTVALAKRLLAKGAA